MIFRKFFQSKPGETRFKPSFAPKITRFKGTSTVALSTPSRSATFVSIKKLVKMPFPNFQLSISVLREICNFCKNANFDHLHSVLPVYPRKKSKNRGPAI